MELAVWGQTFVLLITGGFVCWYTIETARLRRQMVRQNEISLRPVIVPMFEEGPNQNVFKLRNVGAGCAFNVRVQPIKRVFGENTSHQIPYETKFYPLDYLAAGEVAEMRWTVFSNGAPIHEKFLENKFFPTRVTSSLIIVIAFDDVEGGGYEHEITVEPPTPIYKAPALKVDTNIRNVKLKGIRRRAR